ncbi:hypothetical protein F5Y16DRAFT_355961 [Xylariaceae sp. FL0255]|nr:hypothetical protein F5Y16DRAFT_355961 [Xylariaceae sp. FL0255]
MRLGILSVALAAVGFGSAASLTTLEKSVMLQQLRTTMLDYHWSVTRWQAGCGTTGICDYEFHITGAANSTSKPAHPAFAGDCAGSGEGGSYRACTLQSNGTTEVIAKLLPSNATATSSQHKATIQVSLLFPYPQEPSLILNYTGHASSVYNIDLHAPPQSFLIIPDTLSGD